MVTQLLEIQKRMEKCILVVATDVAPTYNKVCLVHKMTKSFFVLFLIITDGEEDALWAMQNAAVVAGAESYYRSFFSRTDSWYFF